MYDLLHEIKSMANQNMDNDKISVSETQTPKCVAYLVLPMFQWQTLKKLYSPVQWKIIRFFSVDFFWKFKNNSFEINE